jgi:hypothetical protein
MLRATRDRMEIRGRTAMIVSFLLLLAVVGLLLCLRHSSQVVVGDHVAQVPLPFFSIKTGNRRYLSLLRDVKSYFQVKLPRSGWKEIEQLGSMHAMSDGTVQITILQRFRVTRYISEFVIIPGR